VRLQSSTGASAGDVHALRRSRKLKTAVQHTVDERNEKTWQSGEHFSTDSEDEDVALPIRVTPPPPAHAPVKEEEVVVEESRARRESTTSEESSSGDDDEMPTKRRPIAVHRDDEIRKQRALLPICADEQRIVEAINKHDVRL